MRVSAICKKLRAGKPEGWGEIGRVPGYGAGEPIQSQVEGSDVLVQVLLGLAALPMKSRGIDCAGDDGSGKIRFPQIRLHMHERRSQGPALAELETASRLAPRHHLRGSAA